MAIDFQQISEWEEWIPDIGGERELFHVKPDETVTMELRLLTKHDRESYMREVKRYEKAGAASSALDRATRQMFVDNVRNVRNYSIGGRELTTGEEIYDDSNHLDMITSITAALIDRSSLDGGLAKKLRRASDTISSRQPSKGNGDAVVATRASPKITLGVSESRGI